MAKKKTPLEAQLDVIREKKLPMFIQYPSAPSGQRWEFSFNLYQPVEVDLILNQPDGITVGFQDPKSKMRENVAASPWKSHSVGAALMFVEIDATKTDGSFWFLSPLGKNGKRALAQYAMFRLKLKPIKKTAARA